MPLDAFDDMLVQPFMVDRSVVAFDIGVLLWLAWLDVPDADVVRLSPRYQLAADIFGAVIDTNTCRFAPLFTNPVQAADHALGRQ